LNYLARLGWSHGDQEIFSRDELIRLFDIDDVNHSASSFDPEKMRWLNQQYIIAAEAARLGPLLEQHLVALGVDVASGPAPERAADAYRERAETLVGMAEACRYCYEEFEAVDPGAAKKHLRPVVLEPLRALRERLAGGGWTASEIGDAVQATAEAFGINMGKLGQPVRVAVTGGSASPSLDVTLELVGRDRALRRLDAAIAHIEARAAAAG
jgi:glutamyl-tRNA synthetase